MSAVLCEYNLWLQRCSRRSRAQRYGGIAVKVVYDEDKKGYYVVLTKQKGRKPRTLLEWLYRTVHFIPAKYTDLCP